MEKMKRTRNVSYDHNRERIFHREIEVMTKTEKWMLTWIRE